MMKAINSLIYIFSFAAILLSLSCNKDSTGIDKSLVCYVEAETNYSTRSCFQLNDGSYIIVGIGAEENSVMARFSEAGDLIWQKQLPGILKVVKKGIPLPTGGFVLAGLDSTYDSNFSVQNGITTINVYDNDGNVNHTVSINGFPGSTSYYYLDFTLLNDGNLAFSLSAKSFFGYSYPRLLILNQSLATIYDQVYYAMPGVPWQDLRSPFIQEAGDGSIYFSFQTSKGITPGCPLTGIMKFNAGDYSLSYFNDSIGQCSEVPASFALDKNGNCCIATAKKDSLMTWYLSYFYDEEFSLSNEVSVIRTDTSGNYIDVHKYSGFPRLGTLMKIIRTKDEGFIMVGTANLDNRYNSTPNTQIFLIKTDANLNQVWMKQISTTYTAVGYDVFETRDGGFAIGAFERSFNKNFKMMIIKTDENGN